jgi:hypothetical protein
MFNIEQLDRDFTKTIYTMGYYASLEGQLSKEYSRLEEIATDKFAKHLLHLISSSSANNADIIRGIFSELSDQGLADNTTKNIMNGWVDDFPDTIRDGPDENNLMISLRKFLAFEEFLKEEYRSLSAYITTESRNSGIKLSNDLSKVAENHEEYNHILRNLIKLSGIDNTLTGILE